MSRVSVRSLVLALPPRLVSFSEQFIPTAVAERGHVAVLRARFLVLASLTVVACSIGFSALFLATGASSFRAITPILIGGSACALFPFGLRAGVRVPVLALLFILTTQLGLVLSIAADGGLADPGVMWLSMTPLIAAFAGGSRLAWRSAVSAWIMVFSLLVFGRIGHISGEGAFSMRAGADVVVLINTVGCSGFVALLASLYEGPMMRHFRHLTTRLGIANDDLRHELGERERAQAAAERSRARAEAASAAKDALLANMSHEFRTPLTAILGFADLLEEEVDPELRAYLASIGRGANRLMGTLDGVLELAWLESASADLDLAPRALAPSVAAAVGTLAPLAAQRGLSLDLDLPTDADLVARIDPAALEHVVRLLTDNALRFTDHGGVVVMARADGGQAVVDVVDTGIGMDELFLEKAFEPFVQASQGDARTHEGTGVGLALARRLVHLMGGTLTLESTPGHGTTARVALPLVQNAASSGGVAWIARPDARTPRSPAPTGVPAQARSEAV